MPFESPQINQQKDLLNEINSTLKKLQSSIDSLNQRINKLETIQNDSNSNIITDLQVKFPMLSTNWSNPMSKMAIFLLLVA